MYQDAPATVFFAAAAVISPYAPTIKYEKVLLLLSPFLLMYFLKSGTLVVGRSVVGSGALKVGSGVVAALRRWELEVCCGRVVAAMREEVVVDVGIGLGRQCRVHARRAVREGWGSGGMVGDGI